MKYFAHIFIGKEFTEIAAGLGKVAFKYGNEDTNACVNLFVADNTGDANLSIRKLAVSTTSKLAELARFDENIEVAWDKENSVQNTELSEFYSKKIFDQILTINNKGDNTFLYVFLHFPFYKPSALETVKLFYNSIEAAGKPSKTDFVGYCDDLAEIIEPNFKIESPSSKQVVLFTQFKEASKMAFDHHFIAIQNTSQNGISLGLNAKSLTDVLAQFALLCVDYYNEIFPNTVEYKDVVSFGLATLYLDKYLFVDYLLRKTVLNSMDIAQINKSDVDVNIACDTANNLLQDKVSLLSGYFQQTEKTFGKEIDNDANKFTDVQQQFDADITQIIERCREIFSTNKLITVKVAILAAILSKTECELFSKSIFNQESKTIDDLFNEPINYFIDNDKTEFYKIEEEAIVNPIPELKDINTKIINLESEIRDLQESLSSLNEQIEKAQKVEDCFIEDGFYHFHNQKFRLLPFLTEEPLEETYVPKEVSVSSIDLRQSFNSVKNQGAQGSCLAHAVTSIFEYAMKLNQTKEFDLSEAFLYYNAREMDTTGDVSIDIDTGSRFKPAMDSLVKYGIALEKFCPYNENIYAEKPNEEAYKDAATRRLIKALNVNRKTNDIKSALAEGYPVAISLNLCKSFNGDNRGYIQLPNEQEIQEYFLTEEKDRHSRHAMVIVGFSDEMQMFVVRNSWGADWGNGGYCYVPYAYINNEKLCNFSCIITEVESLQIGNARMEHMPVLKIDDTDLNIRYYITKATLEKELAEMEENKKRRNFLQLYFEKVKKVFSAPNDRDSFITKQREKQREVQEEIRKTKKATEEVQEEELIKFTLYKKQLIIKIASFVFGTLFFFWFYQYLIKLFSTDVCWFWEDGCKSEINWWWVAAFTVVVIAFVFFKKTFIKHFGLALGIVGCLIILNAIFAIPEKSISKYLLNYWWLIPVFVGFGGIVWYKSNERWKEWRDRRDELDAEILKLNKEITAKEVEINNFKIKTFAAWTLLKSLEKVQNHFQNLYSNYISLINNLRTWYKEISESEDEINIEAVTPNTSLLDKNILDRLFAYKLQSDNTFEIDFTKEIEKYKIEKDYLRDYKTELCNRIAKTLITYKMLNDFDISAHSVDNRFSDIAKPVTRELAAEIDNKSGLFLHINSNERGEIIPSTGIFVPSVNQYKDSLRKKLGKYSEPYFEANDKCRLVFLKTATLWFRECINFK